MESKAAGPSKRVYEDFEPVCKWNDEEGRDVIELHVQGFKKEQLRVQASGAGDLTVTGERPLNDRRWSRFRKQFKLTKEHNLDETRAKLAGGVLRVIVAKKTPPQAAGGGMSWLRTSSWGVGIDKKRALLALAAVAALVGVGVGGFLIWRYLIL